MLLPLSAGAQTATTGASSAAGGTINLFCLDFGKKFPAGQTIKAQGLADDKVRGALSYALGKGYVQSNPYQVQLAVWNIRDGQAFHDINNRGTTVAQEIVSNAGTVPAGSASAVGDLTITNITAADANAAYGTGTVQGMIASNVPIGFVLPASDASFQGMVSVVVPAGSASAATTGSPVVSTATAATVAPTATIVASTAAATIAPTATIVATTVATTAPTATIASTVAATTAATVAPTATIAPTAAATTAPAATVASTVVATTAPTATIASTVAATTTSTVAPTATVSATATTGPTATRAVTAVATGTGGGTVATAVPATLPQTGQPQTGDTTNWGIALVLVAAIAALGSGFVLRRRSLR